MSEHQVFRSDDDPALLAERNALRQTEEEKRSYEAARKQAWESGAPFPEDRQKWAFSFDWWRGAKSPSKGNL